MWLCALVGSQEARADSPTLQHCFFQLSGSASQAHDYRIIKNLHITHVVNATAEISDAFPSVLRYLRLRLSDDAQQDLRQALPEASRFIAEALRGAPGAPGGRVLVHCSLGRSRSSVLTLGFLMEHRRWSLLHAFRWLKERRACAAPNAGFLRQLSDYEELLRVNKNSTEHTQLQSAVFDIFLPLMIYTEDWDKEKVGNQSHRSVPNSF
uniref:protein-tyrosine-phosphatase n=1 Tax=Sinocyclocheilus rhinocerous TaxID=307959 RepID=A0A673HE63_9TELE